MHANIDPNPSGRDFVVGDIHGHKDLLMERLLYEGFDTSKDRLFSVGDMIDRGPDSLQCLKLLDAPWFFAVRGNHEQMMMEWALGRGWPNWHNDFGMWTDDLDETEIAHWAERLMALPISMTVHGKGYAVGICHAEPAGYMWGEMISDESCFQQMVWGRRVLTGNIDPRPVDGIDVTLHGHTPVSDVRRVGNRYFVDTGAGIGERLTVKNIATLVSDYREFSTFL